MKILRERETEAFVIHPLLHYKTLLSPHMFKSYAGNSSYWVFKRLQWHSRAGERTKRVFLFNVWSLDFVKWRVLEIGCQKYEYI